jgi:hypothetical protein
VRAATGAPHGGAARRAARAGAWLAAACLAAAAARPAALAAQQVGNPPERSPYRDIIEHQSITLFGGQFGGNPGRAGVGAMAAWAFGGQLAVRLSGPVDLWVTLGEAASRRHSIIADTNVTKTDSARPGPDVNLPLVLADIGLGLNVTGDKTWHGLAPYVGASLGIVAPTQKVTDPGGFTVGTNFSLVPAVGTRYFLGRTLALRLEVRDYLFRYQYPLAYFDSLTLHYTGPPPRSAVLPLGTTDRQWVHNLTLWLGVSYLFTF